MARWSTACRRAGRSRSTRSPISRCSARASAPRRPASRPAPAAGPICIRSPPRLRPPSPAFHVPPAPVSQPVYIRHTKGDDTMSLGTETTIMIALIPFLAVWGLLALARARERRRGARVFRQIALTDAIHRELGAAAAPEVRQTWSGEWVVSVRVALSPEAIVGTIARIANDLFRRLDRQEPPRLR